MDSPVQNTLARRCSASRSQWVRGLLPPRGHDIRQASVWVKTAAKVSRPAIHRGVISDLVS